jgi:hypothetical protein
MSEEDKRQEQHQNSNHHNITNEGEGDTNRKESTAQRLSNRTARVGALVLQAYQGRKGGISPNKLLFSCITKLVRTFAGGSLIFLALVRTMSQLSSSCPNDPQVNSIQADNNTLGSSKEALDLFEDVSTAVRLKPSGLEQSLVDKVVDIFQTHPVRLIGNKVRINNLIVTNESKFCLHFSALLFIGLFETQT